MDGTGTTPYGGSRASDTDSGIWTGSSGQDTASKFDTGSTITSQRSGSTPTSHLASLPMPKQDMIELFLRQESQTYRDEKIQLHPDQTIAVLQQEVHRVTGIHPGQQHLVHEDTRTVLSDCTMATRSIRSCEITNRSWIKYSNRSRGGGVKGLF